MTVTIEDIKALRDATGVSTMACKKALEEVGGDFEKAVDLLRKKGEAKAADRAVRTAGEGAVFVRIAGGRAALVTLLCETDFVARSPEFAEVGGHIAQQLLDGALSPEDREMQEVKDAGFKLGENIQIGTMTTLTGDVIGSYIHSNLKIGVVVVLEGGTPELARDIAMHAAATSPAVVSPDEVPEELVQREKAIWAEQLAQEGKPAEIVEKIMMGKEKKFREENALVSQSFVKDSDKTVGEILSAAGARVVQCIRYAI